jgi:hypothetical protein
VVDDLTLAHQDDLIEEVEHLRSWLERWRGFEERARRGMNLQERDTDCGAEHSRHKFDRVEDIEGGACIETIGDSIHEFDDSWRQHHLPDCHTSLLSSTHATVHTIADDGVGAIRQTEDLEDIVNL